MWLVNLRKLRKEKGLTQGELAQAVGLKRYNITNYELGRTEPNIQTLKHLTDYIEHDKTAEKTEAERWETPGC